MKKIVILIMAIAIIAIAIYFKDNIITVTQPTPTEKIAVQAFALNNQQNFISYKDEEYGFTVKYPIGFYAQKDDAISGAKVAFRAFLQDDLFEILRVDVLNETASKTDLDVLAEDSGMTFVSRKTTKNNYGQQFELFQFTKTNPQKQNAKINVFQGIYNCQTKQAPYTAIASTAIPESLPQDNNMALYYLHEFKC